MRTATICKEFTFDAAHKLPNHNGKCCNLHGHTYKVQIYVTGPIRLINGAPDEGMVIDFGIIKEIWKLHIEPLCDHRYLNESLPIPITTAEWIARWVFNEMGHRLAVWPKCGSCQISKVRVWETPASFVEVDE